MATEGGGKIKPKRPHQVSRPYDRRPSLLGRMKDTVKDMLSPSWVIDLVNGVRKTPSANSEQNQHPYHQPDGEVPVRRELNRMGNDEGISMNPGLSQPQPPPQHQQQQPATPGNPQTNPLTGYSAPQMTYNAYRPPAPVPQHIISNGDDQPSTSDMAGPGSMCSNMTMPFEQKDYQNQMLHLNESRIRQMQQQMELHSECMSAQHNTSIDSANTTSVSDGSFLWSSSKPKASRPQPPAKGHNPSFNISAFNTSLTSTSESGHRQSPYYPGKTTFGGAAAHRKSRLNRSLNYESSPMRKQIHARPLNDSALGGVTSSTARRILCTLEKMSSPLADAKKIPFDANSSDSILSMTPSYKRRKTVGLPVPYNLSESSIGGPPVARITTPSMASIATNRQTCPVASSSTLSLPKPPPQPSDMSASQSKSDKGSTRPGKMKRDRGTHYSSKAEEEEVEVPDLPTNFTLPVSTFTLPKFSFGVPASTPIKDVASPRETTTTAPSSLSSNSSPQASFTFSSPIVESNSSLSSYTDDKSQKFHFSSPLSVEANGPKHLNIGSSPSIQFAASAGPQLPKKKQSELNFKAPAENNVMQFKSASEMKTGSVMDILGKAPAELKSGSVNDILGKPKTSPNGSIGGIQAATSLKSGSVMDILGKSSTASPPVNSLSSQFKKSEGEWTCDTCLIKNKVAAEKCVACETPKPRPAPPLVMKSSSDWTCDTCLIKNKPDVSKCVACESPRPAAKPSRPSGSSTGFGPGLFTQAKDEWTCDTCLIKNKSHLNKCVACETPKPNKVERTTAPKATTGSGLGDLFKKADGEWTCDTCLIKNKAGASKCVACETSRPGKVTSSGLVTKKADGEWTCDTCLVKNKPDVSKCGCCETPKPGAKPASSSNSTDNNKAPVGFGNFGKKPAGNWECDTCLVSNKAEAHKCIACETPKPGSKLTTGFTNSSGFKFAPSGGFSFGAPKSSASTTTTPGSSATSGFTGFDVGNKGLGNDSNSGGTSLPTSSFTMPKGGGFSFGKPTDKKDEKEQPSASPSIQFNSGTTEITAKQKAVVDMPKPAFTGFGLNSSQDSKDSKSITGGFKFGNSAAASEPKPQESVKPLDSGKPAASSTGGLNFSFGQTNASSVNNSTEAPNFQFGQAVSKDINRNESKPLGAGGFQFSAAGSTQKDTAAPPMFQISSKPANTNATKQVPTESSTKANTLFGDPKTSESGAKPVFGSNLDTKATSLSNTGFQFGVGSAGSSTGVGGLVFGGPGSKPETKSATTSAAPKFSFGASGNTENKQAFATDSPASGGYNFSVASNKAASPNKRVRDDMESGSEAKKGAFSFSSAPSDGTFKFGDKTTNSTNPTSSSGFSFGQSNAPAFGGVKTNNGPQGGGFGGFSSTSGQATTSLFGAPAPAPTPANNASVFGSSAPAPAFNTAATTAAPTFGAPATSNTGGINLSTPSGFNFSGSSSTPSSGIFQFSASNNQNSAAPAPAPAPAAHIGFSLPAAAPAAAPTPTFNATPSINFTGQSQAPGMFNFNANPPANDNPFNATAAGNAGPRRFKKAVRKLRK